MLTKKYDVTRIFRADGQIYDVQRYTCYGEPKSMSGFIRIQTETFQKCTIHFYEKTELGVTCSDEHTLFEIDE